MNKLSLAALLGALTMTSGTAYAQVSCGDVLVADTTMTADLTCGGPGLIVGADDIVLDCGGFSLNGPGSDIGIHLDGRTGVTVKNCVVNRFVSGILLDDSPSNFITKNSVSGSTSAGTGAIQLANGSDGNVLKHNRAYQNSGRGFVVTDSMGNLVIENAAMGNAFRGFDLIDASGNSLIHNFARDNASGGVVISGSSDGNILYDNDVRDSGSEGFAVLSGVNYFSFNQSDDNGTWGISDSTGGGGFYLLNQCAGNGVGPSNPPMLCF